ncbi:phosphate transport system regulatory protein PhoU [Haladaptatus sp. R4]|uniref:phosphate signaling complex protein PhoU n=1 Tax=Haladaptatus sp. R4 TaxID=1679489 RepID=UPI0007B4854A|nr:phosphate signaling complex protein PhoU [Haladaptatus sp. R4]KZN25545.1 phosphate transport system regulatory protein PhoU [Haladaptatus sp. R4]
MPRNDYQAQLTDLRENVLYMSEVVMERLRLGLNALEQKDPELAQEVIEGDDEVNELYLTLEQDCIDLFALQQPVASDLRMIAASFKIITDLERIADLAVNLGEYTLEADHDVFPEVDIQELGTITLDMLEVTMDAYAENDSQDCYAVAERDEELDNLCERASALVVRDLIETELEENTEKEIERLLQDVSRLLLTIRDLERIGDHSVNIAARTFYMVENDDELIY